MKSMSPLDQFERMQEASRRRSLHDLELAELMISADWETWDNAENVLVPSHKQWEEMRDPILDGLRAAARLMRFNALGLRDEVEIGLLAIAPEKRAEEAHNILDGAAISTAFLQVEEWLHFLVAASWRLKAARAYALSHVANTQQFDPKSAVEL